MPALIDLRRRIKSIRNTQQITQAMKTVASARLKKLQRVVLETRPYWHESPSFFLKVAQLDEGPLHPLLQVREEKKVLVVIITSDKGLCGAFNSNLLEKTWEFLAQKATASQLKLALVGKKAILFFKHRPDYPVVWSCSDHRQEETLQNLKELTQQFIEEFLLQQLDAVYVAFNEFKSILAPLITINRLLPIGEDIAGSSDEIPSLPPLWEPDAREILDKILPLYLETQMIHFYYESQAAEQAARMMAMENASSNAEDLISELTLVMNKIRQASITKELLEIMTAVEALK
jgi:F-type H+-transporting ATPase subunit gamma